MHDDEGDERAVKSTAPQAYVCLSACMEHLSQAPRPGVPQLRTVCQSRWSSFGHAVISACRGGLAGYQEAGPVKTKCKH